MARKPSWIHSPSSRSGKRGIVWLLEEVHLCIQKKYGSFFKVSSLKAIRAAVDRFLKSAPNNKPWSIISDPQFKQANNALDAFAKSIRWEGKVRSQQWTTCICDVFYTHHCTFACWLVWNHLNARWKKKWKSIFYTFKPLPHEQVFLDKFSLISFPCSCG